MTSPHAHASGFSIAGQVVLLTGGAGLYGRGLTAQLAAAGARLSIASRDVGALEKIAAEECGQGHSVRAHAFDQGNEASILRLRDWVQAEFGPLDGLVNNAVARPMKSFDAPLADWEASMKINATGLFAVARAFGELMVARGSGSIVNLAVDGGYTAH